MDKVEQLVHIWNEIPTVITDQLDLTQQEIIDKYMDVFHFGDYFYVIFNTQTTQMEYVNSNVEKVLGYSPEEFNLPLILDSIHPDDLNYYYHYEKSAVQFFSQLPPELFFKYKFSYDYRLKTKGASYKRILQQVI